jgi:hypothetical protein
MQKAKICQKSQFFPTIQKNSKIFQKWPSLQPPRPLLPPRTMHGLVGQLGLSPSVKKGQKQVIEPRGNIREFSMFPLCFRKHKGNIQDNNSRT